jgi:sucrose-6-phosphate hydrolase SacC (GH32 family)
MASLLASTAFAAETKEVIDQRHRPCYHFVVPDSKQGPFDPNGNIYWKGRHHIFYIFMVPDERFPRKVAAPFGHASSTDLVNWTFHPWALEPAPGEPVSFDEVKGDCLEIHAEIDPADAESIAVAVRCSPDGREKTVIVYDAKRKTLAIDVSKSSVHPPENLYMRFAAGRRFERYGVKNEPVLVQEAPFSLKPGEPLRLRIFLDRCMLEVFAGGRQALCQQIFPAQEDSLGVQFEARGGAATLESLYSWQMGASIGG